MICAGLLLDGSICTPTPLRAVDGVELCSGCAHDWRLCAGPFASWTKEQRAAFAAEAIAKTQREVAIRRANAGRFT